MNNTPSCKLKFLVHWLFMSDFECGVSFCCVELKRVRSKKCWRWVVNVLYFSLGIYLTKYPIFKASLIRGGHRIGFGFEGKSDWMKFVQSDWIWFGSDWIHINSNHPIGSALLKENGAKNWKIQKIILNLIRNL